MGVPKFYRWLSERYPCINENVNQHNMPEFDYFYVDINGVFHNCSHPSDDVHFRITLEQIFDNITTYLEFLFNLVKPRKVFFLSVDGVAPRSKMNQQRSRRFKTAKEAIEKEAKAKKLGETLPDDPRFDSNCITPGTEFMDQLHHHLVKWIANKIQKNQAWKGVKVIYSGHDVPGEGEHKIMDYIRFCKTKNLFKGNLRHCLYGLDADLINLGLSSHEPYFSLLREEVNFSKNNNRRSCDPFVTNWQLLHLSILRNYLEKEFEELKEKLTFAFDLEQIIDDWILLNFLVGNDFLPHVAKFHVDKGSIQILYDKYKQALPKLDGYLNQGGELNLVRYKKFLEHLAEHDEIIFNETTTDLKYFDSSVNEQTFGPNNEKLDGDDGFDFEASAEEADDDEESSSSCNEDEFTIHKNYYYQSKLHFKDIDREVVDLANEYIKGLQWVLHYYFNGCVSWSWYYPFYYAPYVSDLAKFDLSVNLNFQRNQPFTPLQQLLAVIPQASKQILPKVFQPLATSSDSPLKEFFPTNVKTDLNEKIHDYEAIILIPFINEQALLDAFKDHESQLTTDERTRNRTGSFYIFSYSQTPISGHVDERLKEQRNVKLQTLKHDHYVLSPEKIFKGIRKDIQLNQVIGFPSLNGIRFTVKVSFEKIKLFNYPSKYLNMSILIEQNPERDVELVLKAKERLDDLVYINWPLLSQGKLIEILTPEHRFRLEKGKLKVSEATKEEYGYAKQFSGAYCSEMRNKKGIQIERVHIVAKVLPLEAQRYIVKDSTLVNHKEWSKQAKFVPLDLVVFDVPNYRDQNPARTLANIFVKGKSFFVTSGVCYGSLADVLKYEHHANQVEVRVHLTTNPSFGEVRNAERSILKDEYLSENQLMDLLQREFNLPSDGFRKLLGMAFISYTSGNSREKKTNIGLRLRYRSSYQLEDGTSDRFCIPGYSMYRGNDCFYSTEVLEILRQYYEKFPFVFQILCGPKGRESIKIQDLFPQPKLNEKEKVKQLSEIKNWIDSLNLKKVDHVQLGARYLDTTVVKLLEDAVNYHNSYSVVNKDKVVFMSPESFFIPECVLKGSPLPDSLVSFRLYDRVVNIKSNISVPYGLRGTVIGIYSKCVDNTYDKVLLAVKQGSEKDDVATQIIEVMFDQPFDNGIKARSSTANIYRMQAPWLINITYGFAKLKFIPEGSNIAKAQPNLVNMPKNAVKPINSLPPTRSVTVAVAHCSKSKPIDERESGEKLFNMLQNRASKEFTHSATSPFKTCKKGIAKEQPEPISVLNICTVLKREQPKLGEVQRQPDERQGAQKQQPKQQQQQQQKPEVKYETRVISNSKRQQHQANGTLPKPSNVHPKTSTPKHETNESQRSVDPTNAKKLNPMANMFVPMNVERKILTNKDSRNKKKPLPQLSLPRESNRAAEPQPKQPNFKGRAVNNRNANQGNNVNNQDGSNYATPYFPYGLPTQANGIPLPPTQSNPQPSSSTFPPPPNALNHMSHLFPAGLPVVQVMLSKAPAKKVPVAVQAEDLEKDMLSAPPAKEVPVAVQAEDLERDMLSAPPAKEVLVALQAEDLEKDMFLSAAPAKQLPVAVQAEDLERDMLSAAAPTVEVLPSPNLVMNTFGALSLEDVERNLVTGSAPSLPPPKPNPQPPTNWFLPSPQALFAGAAPMRLEDLESGVLSAPAVPQMQHNGIDMANAVSLEELEKKLTV